MIDRQANTQQHASSDEVVLNKLAIEGMLVLPAELDIKLLPKLVKQNNWLQLEVTQVDFSQVDKADSSILSLLLYWAKKQNAAIHVYNLPEHLHTLLELYDMQEVIELH